MARASECMSAKVVVLSFSNLSSVYKHREHVVAAAAVGASVV